MTGRGGEMTPWRRERVLSAIGGFGFGEIDIGVRTLTAILRDACPLTRRWELPWGDDTKVPIHTAVLEALVYVAMAAPPRDGAREAGSWPSGRRALKWCEYQTDWQMHLEGKSNDCPICCARRDVDEVFDKHREAFRAALAPLLGGPLSPRYDAVALWVGRPDERLMGDGVVWVDGGKDGLV